MVCTVCNEEVEKYSNGKKCRKCYNAYMRSYQPERYHRRRLEAIVLLGAKCANCGTEADLELDHTDRSQKEHEISNGGLAEEKFWNEVLNKCQLLCGSCHRSKSASERSVGHGEGASGKRNCPCSPCRARKAEYMKNWKKQRS